MQAQQRTSVKLSLASGSAEIIDGIALEEISTVDCRRIIELQLARRAESRGQSDGVARHIFSNTVAPIQEC